MVPLIDKSQPRDVIQVLPIVVTFMTSSAWHGYYGGYYLTMFGYALLIVTCKFWYRTQLFATLDSLMPSMLAPFIRCFIGQGLGTYFSFAFCYKLTKPSINAW